MSNGKNVSCTFNIDSAMIVWRWDDVPDDLLSICIQYATTIKYIVWMPTDAYHLYDFPLLGNLERNEIKIEVFQHRLDSGGVIYILAES